MLWDTKDYMRPPNWRWDMAITMYAAKQEHLNTLQTHDIYFRAAYRYVKLLNKYCPEIVAPKYSKTNPVSMYKIQEAYNKAVSAGNLRNCAEAHRVYASAGPDRWILEAALVADTDVSELSDMHGWSKGTTMAYRAIFFDVKHKLKYPMRVWNDLMAPALTNLAGNIPDSDIFLKQLAYEYGIGIVMALLKSSMPSNEVVQTLREMQTNKLLKAETLATFALNPAYDKELILTMAAERRKVETDMAIGTNSTIRESLEALRDVFSKSLHEGMIEPGYLRNYPVASRRLREGRLTATKTSGMVDVRKELPTPEVPAIVKEKNIVAMAEKIKRRK